MTADLRSTLDTTAAEPSARGASSDERRAARLGVFREHVRIERERLRADHDRGAGGTQIVEQWTAAVDMVVAEAFRTAPQGPEQEAGLPAVVALGGYGRGALNVSSDIDIMFLFRDRVQDDSEMVKDVLHLLWDLDFDVGHATRTIAQAVLLAMTDDTVMTSLLDGRRVAGPEDLYAEFTAGLRGKLPPRRTREFSELKVTQMHERRAKHGGYAQMLEPDVKESAGGLRDVHTIQWIMEVRWGTSDLGSLVEHKRLSQRDCRSLVASLDLIWRVRNALHFMHGRKNDRILFDAQQKIAERFGYSDSSERLGVELFMRDYYLAAREVVRITDAVCHRLTSRVSRATQVADLVRQRVLSDGTRYVRGKILLPLQRTGFFSQDPFRLLSVFANLQAHRAILSEAAARSVHRNMDLVDDAFRRSPVNAEKFMGMMKISAHLGDTLRKMHAVGLLGEYIPEFGRLTCLSQHDHYHAYTADEHSLITVQTMVDLADRGDGSRVADVYRRVERLDLLHLSALLHDVGKSGGRGHAERGAEMTGEILDRLGLSQDDQDVVAFLVAHHLDLGHVSERRDLDDQTMIDSLAVRFNDVAALDMLYVLTWADMNSTQSEPASDWKCRLLETLYESLRLSVEGRGHEHSPNMLAVLESPRKFRDQLAERIGADRADSHVSGMPRRYSLNYSLDQAEHHALRCESLASQASVLVDVVAQEGGRTAEVVVYAHDRTYLLSDICGVLAVNDLNILYADAYTRADGIVVDVFGVDGLSSDTADYEQRVSNIEQVFRDVWEGSAKVADLMVKHRRRWARLKPGPGLNGTHVVFDDNISEDYTVLDVFTKDRIGLLHDLSRAISSYGLDIHVARIGTDADRVADAFYITTAEGTRLTDGAEYDALREVITDALDGPQRDAG